MVTTVTGTVPDPGGVVTCSRDPLSCFTFVPSLWPNLTALACSSLVPVIVTTVPPAAEPLLGVI